MKEKIEEKIKKIIGEYSYFLGDGDEYNFNMPKVVEELSTLIQEERKEAVEGFAKWIRPNCDYDLGDFEGYAKEYLESEK